MNAPRGRRRASDPPEPRKRILVLIPQNTFQQLEAKADAMGWSRSRLAAMAIEKGLPLLTDSF